MTVYTTHGSFTNQSDAAFAEWVGRTLDALNAVMVRTADTGQIDPGTAVRPAATNTVAGYAIYRFNDDAQSLRPVFLRVEFGSGGSGATWPNLRVTVCKGTNGAGEPLGVLYAAPASGYGYGRCNIDVTPPQWLISAGPGYVAIFPAAAPAGVNTAGAGTPFFVVERSPDGLSVLIVDAQRGNMAVTSPSTVTPVASVVTYESGAVTAGAPPVMLPQTIAGAPLAAGTPLAAASLGPVFPWVVFPPGEAPWQSRAILSYPGGDAPGSTFQVTLEGEDRTYRAVPLSEAYHAFGLGLKDTSVSRYVGAAIRWE